MTADPMKIALADKSKPLKMRPGYVEGRKPQRPTTCKLSGCPIDEHTAAIVTIPGIGTACAGCAEGHGWTVRYS